MKTFRPDIEGLRGIAILVVVAYHARIVPGGFVGVDVFFVLSGYLITGILIAEYEKSGKINLVNFYARRIRRLLPAAATMLFISIIAAFIILPPIQQVSLPQTAFFTALYTSNLWFFHTTTDYLAAPPESNPFLHTWSLSIEEQFYLVFPLLTLWSLKFGRRGLVIAISVVGIVSFAMGVYFTYTYQPFAFFSPVTRAWEFAIGGAAVLIALKPKLGLAGLLMIITAVFLFDRQTMFPGWIVLIPVLGTVLILMSGAKYLDTPILRYFGKVSYSFYLWHWVVLVFAAALWGELSPFARIVGVLVSLGIAHLSYTFIENPVRTSQFLARRPIAGIAMAIILTAFGVGTSLAFRKLSETAAQHDRFTKAKLMPKGLYENCDLGLFDSTLKTCEFGSGGKTVVLFGDSHALQWFPAVEQIAKEEDWHLVTVIKSSCGPVDLEISNFMINRPYYECFEWRARAFEYIRQLNPDLVITGVFQRTAFGRPADLISLETWQQGVQKTLDDLKNIKIAYITDTPRPGYDVMNCLAQNEWQKSWRRERSCSFEHDASISEDLAKGERSVVEASGSKFIDMNEYICPGAICEPLVNNIIVYRDSHHLSTAFGQSLAPALKFELSK